MPERGFETRSFGKRVLFHLPATPLHIASWFLCDKVVLNISLETFFFLFFGGGAQSLNEDSHRTPSEQPLKAFNLNGWSDNSGPQILLIIRRSRVSRCCVWTPLSHRLVLDTIQAKAADYLGHRSKFTWTLFSEKKKYNNFCSDLHSDGPDNFLMFNPKQGSSKELGLLLDWLHSACVNGFCQLNSTSRQVGKQGSRVGIRCWSFKSA